MKTIKGLSLTLVLVLVIAPILVAKPAFSQSPVYFDVQPKAVPPLTNLNTSANGLTTPASPSPVGDFFTVTIHFVGATAANVPAGVAGIEVHFDFSNILSYATPINFTDQTGTFIDSPLFGLGPAFFAANGTNLKTNPNGAAQYEVAAATSSAGNTADGVVVVLWFKITGQPQGTLGQQNFLAQLTISFGSAVDGNGNSITVDLHQGTLQINAVPGAPAAKYTLTVNVVGNGTVTQNPLLATYASGTIVTLSAVPSSLNFTFSGWSGDITGSKNPLNITMDANKTVTATFRVAVHGLLGDLNHDGKVNLEDLALFASAWKSHTGDPNFITEADFNNDGIINLADFVTFAVQYGKSLINPP